MKLYYKSYGQPSQKPIVILHGFLGNGDNWATIAKQLDDDAFIIVPDMRNHGRSPHDDEMSIEIMAQDVINLLQELSIESCTLVGHSMGGKIAMQCALDAPHLFSSLVIVDVSTRAYHGGHEHILAAMDQLKLADYSSRSELDTALSQFLPSQSLRAFLLKNVKRNSSGFSWKINLPILIQIYPELLVSFDPPIPIDIPACFIRGEQSGYIMQEDIDLIEERFTDVEFLTIKNAGHWIHADAPDETIKHIKTAYQKSL